ncbi:MAG: hypothetical protein ACI4TX_00305 [Christensenellales bacterium]
MYYCRDCKKVVKNGNRCSCGKELTRKDEIIYCPTCNKMYFKPSKSFTCKKCNSFVKVEDGQAGNVSNGGDDVNSIYASMFLNNGGSGASGNSGGAGSVGGAGAGSGYNSGANVGGAGASGYSSGNNLNNYSNNNAINNNGGAVGGGATSGASNSFGDSTKERFPHKAFENQGNVSVGGGEQASGSDGSGAGASGNGGGAGANDDIDVSKFEDVGAGGKGGAVSGGAVSSGAEDGKAKKGGKVKKAKGSSSGGGAVNKLGMLAIAMIFVFALVFVFYLFILPLLTPSYKANWDKYISAKNDINLAQGNDTKYYTVDFKVESETDTVIIASVKVEQKAYDEVNKKYNNLMITYSVEFTKKGGEFVISKVTEA